MADTPTTSGGTLDIPVPAQPPTAGTSPAGESDMQDSTQLAFEQSFAKSHALGLAQMDRENSANGNIAEQTRLDFINSNNNVVGLAQAVLAQRSAGGQPQSSSAGAGVSSGH